MEEVVIVDAVRTPVGKHGGMLSSIRADDLCAIPLVALVERTGIDPALVEEVYMGCANQAGEDNRDVARMALLLAGFPHHVAGVTFNRLCASGLTAVNQAARAIAAGEGDIYIAGGVENMSRSPWSISKQERAFAPGHVTAYDTTLGWRYPNPKLEALFPLEAMGETAENIYEKYPAFTREKQDAFALESHRRAVEAINTGRFDGEIVPVTIPQHKGDPLRFDTDEHPRCKMEGGKAVLDTSLESLARLKPLFRAGGTVTAGNSSGLNDGATAILMMSAKRADQLGFDPIARWVGSAAAGVDPRTMGLGPVPATEKALSRAGLTIGEIDLIEVNEAFAVQSLAVMELAGFDPAITNVNGGAIALGHPLGCSGARIMTTLLHELHRRKQSGQSTRFGLATLCVGVGQGETTIIEAV
ncbi:MAG: thiolase family protein [Anaerolineae bacterium]|nr:thiolase family protein [Anaerolineae bacterium]